MRLSARNVFPGKVLEVTKGVTAAHVELELSDGGVVAAAITNGAVERLGLVVSMQASAEYEIVRRIGCGSLTSSRASDD